MAKPATTGRSSTDEFMNIDLMRSLVKQYSELVSQSFSFTTLWVLDR